MSSTQHSGLLTLPPELRNKIYELTFPFLAEHAGACWIRPGGRSLCDCSTQLLAVCKQLRSELLPIYYSTHMLTLWLHPGHKAKNISWINAFTEDGLAHIRRVRFDSKYWGNGWHPETAIFVVNLDALEHEVRVQEKTNYPGHYQIRKRRELLVIAQALPVVDGKFRFTKDAVLSMMEAVKYVCFDCQEGECKRRHGDWGNV